MIGEITQMRHEHSDHVRMICRRSDICSRNLFTRLSRLLHEEGTNIMTNIHGLVYMPYTKANVSMTFGAARRPLLCSARKTQANIA